MRARLPPMNALKAFEALGRCGSINRAADELGVVRGAVRQQITVLENQGSLSKAPCGGAGSVASDSLTRQ